MHGDVGHVRARGRAGERPAIHEALERGVTLLDTGDFYGMGHNELLVGRALKGRRDGVLLSVKFGGLRSPDGGWLGYDEHQMRMPDGE
jgi:aryl-alcohol dehydrogenase-like predicted oxidoreductase